MEIKKYKLTIQYDGSNFHGWQVQKNVRTIQGDIENALSVIFPNEKISLVGSSRTDTGVHALAQIAHVNLPMRLNSGELCNALNSNLNNDVRVVSVKEKIDDFHARYSAISREYEYRYVKNFSPITRKYATELKWEINPNLLTQCANFLIGQHDFSCFCKSTAEVDNKICVIYEAKWEEQKKGFIFRIRSNRFLQHMVRYLVGTMVEVSRGRYKLKDFNDLIKCNKTDAIVVRAPAQGLFLKQVNYD